MNKQQTPPPLKPQPVPPHCSAKQWLLFDFFDKFGGLSWSEKLQAAFYTGFPHKWAIFGSWGTLLLGWLYLAYIGLINPAIVLLSVLMLCITLSWYFDTLWCVLPYGAAQIWAAVRTPYNHYLLRQHAWHAWW